MGVPLKGKKVLVVDDAVTAGTSKRGAIEKISKEGGVVVGIVVALDRMEKLPAPNGDGPEPTPSAIGELRKKYGIPVLAVLALEHIIKGSKGIVSNEDAGRMEEYKAKYRPSD